MAIPLRGDFDAVRLRVAARRTKDAAQARRLLALAAVYDGATRTEVARIGGVTLQIVRASAWCMDRAGDRLGIGWGLPPRERAPPCPSRRTPTGGIEFRGSSTGSRIGLRTRQACVPAAA
jgi:hypothetical protein